MSNKQFISNLSATYADVRKLDAKKINLKGKNILEYIEESVPTITHSQDTRETITENDLWGQWVETKDDGTVVIHDDYLSNPNGTSSAWLSNVTKVEDNKAYNGDTVVANIQTEMIKDGSSMFYETSIASFSGDLSSLVNGYQMFDDCDDLTTFTTDLNSLTNGYRMFYQCVDLTSFAGDSSGSPVNLSSLVNGEEMFFKCWELNSFNSNLSSLTNGIQMFFQSGLETFNSDLSSLTNGYEMFYQCDDLTTFSSNLSSLTFGDSMFRKCKAFTTFTTDLSSLDNGENMFLNCENLTTFTSDLSSLISGSSMFRLCTNLTTFTSDLSSLISGSSMFQECTNFTTFTSDLSSLVHGRGMFYKTKLTPKSVMYIVESIKDIVAEKKLYQDGIIPYVTLSNNVYSAPKGFMSDGKYVYTFLYSVYNEQTFQKDNPQPYTTAMSAGVVGKLTLGINVTNNSNTIEQQLQTFAEGCLCDSWEELKQEFIDKGWTVTFQYGGTTDEIPNTYDLRNGEQIIPCPIFAKLVEADKDSAEYCTEDASTFYNIDWGHDVTDTSSYTQFNSLEDAMTSWNVFPKENIITTEE